ncbi:hypothetical protein BT638P3_00024 [Bacteroides phage BT638P3]|nr:hypothetical protein BT638P3_00024 [Bacteroides phage BT638P3]WAX09612.1 hypothetical protein BT638P4_00001 [Bacteroides phage BT638P4]
MNDPICAVCGESKNINLLMFNHGICLCHRCTAIAAEAFIKERAEKRLREAGKKEEAKGEYMERVDSERRMKEFDALMKKREDDRKVKVGLEKAEEATRIHIADLSIENNRLRTKLKDLEEAHLDFLDRCFWLFWIMPGLGVAAGVLASLIVK